jgi:hypothetical protein
MNLISIFGAGLLVGASLLIILPEGISQMYSAFRDSLIEETGNPNIRGR